MAVGEWSRDAGMTQDRREMLDFRVQGLEQSSLSCHQPSAKQKKQQDPQHKGEEEENPIGVGDTPERFSFLGFTDCEMW